MPDPATNAKQVNLKPGAELQSLFGQGDEHLKAIEEALHVRLVPRNGHLTITGEAEDVALAELVVEELTAVLRRGGTLEAHDVRNALKHCAARDAEGFRRLRDAVIEVSPKKRPVRAKSEGQRRYVEAIGMHDIVFGIGPAGTGKTYLARATAGPPLLRKEVSRIILPRPAVEAGERLGFLPGTLYDKINPYLRPLYDALHDMIEAERAARMIEMGTIEIAPLAFMRGRTLNDSFIILDEAQNTSSEQMKMFLTRLGFNSKTVITGDITQVDLPAGKVSGLIEVRSVLREIPGIQFVYLKEEDVVRHELVQCIIRAYEAYQVPPPAPGDGRP